MKVAEKTSGQDIWGYFVKVSQDLHGMNRIYIGSKGDYGMTGIYARGYLDNVRLTVPSSQASAGTPAPTFVTTAITTLPTPYRQLSRLSARTGPCQRDAASPSSPVVVVAALCIGALGLLIIRNRH
jgi:hypothetical protein